MNWKKFPLLYLATFVYAPRGMIILFTGGLFFNGDGDRAVLISGKLVKKRKGQQIGKEELTWKVTYRWYFLLLKMRYGVFFYSIVILCFTLSEWALITTYLFDFGKFQTPQQFFWFVIWKHLNGFWNQAAENNYASVFISNTNPQKNIISFS